MSPFSWEAQPHEHRDDAIERLRERIGALEAERERIKAVNANIRLAARKGSIADLAAYFANLSEKERAELLMLAKVQSYYDPLHKGYPPYVLANLSGNIKRNRDRLAQLQRVAAQRERVRLTLEDAS